MMRAMTVLRKWLPPVIWMTLIFCRLDRRALGRTHLALRGAAAAVAVPSEHADAGTGGITGHHL